MLIPIEALPALGMHARRFLSQKSEQLTPEWLAASASTVQSFRVGQFHATDGDRVVLMCDPGQANEILLSFQNSLAQELADGLHRVARSLQQSQTSDRRPN